MSIVFVNIESEMLNHAAGAWIAAAKGINLTEFMKMEPMLLPDSYGFCVALVAMINAICDNSGHIDDRQAFIIILREAITNLAVVEGPKRI